MHCLAVAAVGHHPRELLAQVMYEAAGISPLDEATQ